MKNYPVLALIMALCHAVGIPNTLVGQTFEVSGYCAYRDLTSGRPEQQDRAEFTVAVDRCRWVMVFVYRDGSRGTFNFDGKYLRAVVVPADHSGQPKADSSTTGVGAIISKGVFLDLMDVKYWLCWTAFASGCVLEARPESLPPIFCFDHIEQIHLGYRVPIRLSLHTVPPFLPEDLRFVDLAIVQTNRDSSLGRVPEFPQGYTNNVFQVAEWTNVGSLAVPKSFSMVASLPRKMVPWLSGEDSVFNVYSVSGEVKTATPTPSLAFAVPDFPGRARVSDRRELAGVPRGAVTEYFTNRWLSEAEATDLVKDGRVVIQWPLAGPVRPRSVPHAVPKLLVVLIAAANLVFLAVISWLALRRRERPLAVARGAEGAAAGEGREEGRGVR